MIKGIGIDLVKNSRVKLIHKKYKESFAKKILSEDELSLYRSSKSKTTFLSKRFASKEAFSKAIGTGLYRNGIYPSSLTIQHKSESDSIVAILKILPNNLDFINYYLYG